MLEWLWACVSSPEPVGSWLKMPLYFLILRERLLCTKDIFTLLLSITQLGFHSDLYRAMKMVTISISSWWRQMIKEADVHEKVSSQSLEVYMFLHKYLMREVGFFLYHSDKLIYMQPVTHNIASNMQKSVNELGPLFYYSGGVGIWDKITSFIKWLNNNKKFFCTQS